MWAAPDGGEESDHEALLRRTTPHCLPQFRTSSQGVWGASDASGLLPPSFSRSGAVRGGAVRGRTASQAAGNRVTGRCAVAGGPPDHAGLEGRMAPGMLGQVVTAHETLVAERAGKALLPSVGAEVTGQLIGAGKLLLAARPAAGERPLTCRGKKKVTVYLSRTSMNRYSLSSNAWRQKPGGEGHVQDLRIIP